MRRLLILFALLICAMTITACGNGGLSEEAGQCYVDLQYGIQMEADASSENFSDWEEYKAIRENALKEELEYLSKYQNIDFGDEELNYIISTYVGAVESQCEGIKYMFSDASKYNNLYNDSGVVVRMECINKLIDNYNFTVNEEYYDSVSTYLAQKIIVLFNADERIQFDTDYGQLALTVEGWSDIQDKGTFGKFAFLLSVVENVSYEYSAIDFTDYITVYGDDCIGIGNSHYGYSYNEYSSSTGYEEMNQGEKMRVAISYQVSKQPDMICVNINDPYKIYRCFMELN